MNNLINHLTALCKKFVTRHRSSAVALSAIISITAFGSVAATTPMFVNPNLSPTFVFNPNTITPLPRPVDDIVYVAKFVCGPQTLAATRIGQITEYSDLQPGNYATALNMLLLIDGAAQIEVFASMDGHAIKPLVAQLPVSGAFHTVTVACDEILASFGVSVRDEAYEGFLYITRSQADLEIQAVYTYASRDQFAEFRGVDNQGDIVINPEINLISIGGSGGLGLGASIDIERIIPINRSGLTTN